MKIASGFIIAFIMLATMLSAQSTAPIQAESPMGAWQSPVTGRVVSGVFLDWFKSHCDLDYLGHPLSELMWDSTTGLLTQQFERGTLELRDNRVQRRLVVDQLWPDNDPPIAAEVPDDANYVYFATEAGGLGHAVRNNVLQNGRAVNIGFKDFFERCGGVETFGYPKEEAQLRGTRWTQRFQGALFQYFAENDTDALKPGSDIPYRRWKVQPALVSEIVAYAAQAHKPQPGMMNVNLVFLNRDGNQLVAQTRQVPFTTGIIRATLTELLKGPQDDNLRAAIAPGTRLLSLEYKGGIALPTFSAHFLMSENRQWAVQSITQSLTQIRGVNGVRFCIEGKPLAYYWGADFAKVFTR